MGLKENATDALVNVFEWVFLPLRLADGWT